MHLDQPRYRRRGRHIHSAGNLHNTACQKLRRDRIRARSGHTQHPVFGQVHQYGQAVEAVGERDVVGVTAAAAADRQQTLLVAFYSGVLAAEAEGFVEGQNGRAGGVLES